MNNLVIFRDAEKRFLESGIIFWDGIFVTYFTLGYWVWMMMMMMMINFINVSRPHSLGKSHTNLGTQLIDIKNM